MQRKWAMLAAGAMLSTMLTGCMENHGELGNRNIRGNSVSYDMNGNRILNTRFANDQMNEMNRVDGHRLNSNNLVGLHKNYRLEMSEAMADRISGIKGVGKAYVMLTDDNAYVAVSLKDDAGKKGANAMSLSAPAPIGRTQQAYMRPYNMKSTNAHALNTHRTRASSIATPNMHLASTKNTYGMNGMIGTSSTYGTNGMYGTSGTSMYGTAGAKGPHMKSQGLANGKQSSSFHNVSNGMKNMSLGMNANSYLRGPSKNYVSSNRNNINGLTTRHPNGITNMSRNTARGLNNLSTDVTGTTNLSRTMNRGTNALYRDASDVTRGTANLGRDAARGTMDLGRDVSRGMRDLARGTGDVLRGAVNLPRDVARGTVDLGRDVARGTTDLGRDVARGTTDVTRDTARGMSSLSTGMPRGADGMTRTVMPYAAGRMAADSDVTTAMKAQIASEVKKMSPSIKNVYVSANPDFVDRMGAYMADVKAGHPIQGFIAEFNAMVDRIFPTRSRP
ncbi:YhcN/YlaJ family sporulation lipoprotein [Paenibacillus glycinis]|uniref:YhcN/YlaJ family sporulation lipoprotein n=1 Tax=Paenibacillus glycinis TaxID=2697035 RepID=A0ABW9XX73_9BACL|nr:YhcN/YlaJ family sporulation lipoprotein [Paenibacillus glycinis]NBD27323.1 hypothetical protein [Paenibacillus glycinis]